MSEDVPQDAAPKKKKNIWKRADQADDVPLVAAPQADEKGRTSEKPKEESPKKKKGKGQWSRKNRKEKDESEASEAKTAHEPSAEETLDMHGVDQKHTYEEEELKPTWPRAIAAALVNWLLMCAFAVAQGAIMFIDEPNWRNMSMAMNMNLFSASVLGIVINMKSDAPIFIAGPDLTSCILMGDSIRKLSNHVAEKLKIGFYPVPELAPPAALEVNDSRRLFPQAEDSQWYFGEEIVNDWWMNVQQTKASALSLSSWSLQDLFGFSLSTSADEARRAEEAGEAEEAEEAEDRIDGIDDEAGDLEEAKDIDDNDAHERRLSARRRDGRRRDGRRRRTTTTTTTQDFIDVSEFCKGKHYRKNLKSCYDYHVGVRCTTVLICMSTSLTTGIILFFLGYLKLVRYVEFIPRGITDAFSTILGIKTFTAAVRICLMLPKFFLPAMLAGVPMYFVLTRRIGNPAFTMPFFIVVPCVMWTAHLKRSGITMEAARKDKLYLPLLPDEMAWNTYADLRYSDYWHWQIYSDIYQELISLVVLIVLNSITTGLQMSESTIPVRIHRDVETKIAGIANLAMFPLAGIPGFAQFRFNVCNWATQRNVKDRRAGKIYAALCFVTALAPKSAYLLYIPRNMFAIVLFCGGAGYIAEHLWGSRKYLSFAEWSQVIAIIVVFVRSDSIAHALVLGACLTGAQFISKYSKVPCIDGVPMHGGELISRERHEPLMMRSITHIANSWVLIIRLQGYVFFSAVTHVTQHIREIMHREEDEHVPVYRQLKFVIMDGAQLNGLECSASKDLERLREEATSHGIVVLWSSLQPDLVDELMRRNVILSEKDNFLDMYEAMLEIEQHIRVFRNKIQERWVSLHPMFKQAQDLIRMRENFEPFRFVFPFDAARFGCPWMYCSKKSIKAFETVLWEDDEPDKELFLIHSGAVGVFKRLPKESEDWTPPEVIYKHGWFLNRQFLFRELAQYNGIAMEDGEVLSWNTHQWWKMIRERPVMASAIMEAAMRQMNFDQTVVSSLLAMATKIEVDDEGEIDVSHMYKGEGELMCPTDIPFALAHQIQGLEAAQFLKEFKLYEPIEADSIATALPEMPRKLRDDLALAFWTYASGDFEGNWTLPSHKVKEALMFAGIFNMLGVEVAENPLTEKEFIAVGHETALTRLSKKQVAKIYNIFKSYDKDKSGHLDRDEMIIVFRETFHPTISEDEVNGICGAWDDNGSGQIDAKEFVGILSRFIRKHEVDWNLLLGIREVLKKHKKEKVTHKDMLTMEHLMNNKYNKMTEEEAQEMLWACDCFDLTGDGKEIDLAGFVAAVILNTEYAVGRLPPKARKAPKKGHTDPKEADDGTKPKKKRKSEKNADDEPEEDENEFRNQSKMLPTKSEVEDDKLKKEERKLPPTAMLKNGIMPHHGKKKDDLPDTRKARLRTMLEYPQSSRRAQCYAYVMALFVVLSFAKPGVEALIEASGSSGNICPKDYPFAYYTGFTWCCHQAYEKDTRNTSKGQGRSCDGSAFHANGFLSKCCKGNKQVKCLSPPCANYDVDKVATADEVAIFVCVAFSLDYLLRFWVCTAHGTETRWQFIFHPINLCDLGSILPFWYALARGSGDSTFYRMMRITRILRLTKNAKVQKVGKRSGVVVPIMVVFFVVMGAYYRAYSVMNS